MTTSVLIKSPGIQNSESRIQNKREAALGLPFWVLAPGF
jgi:hypothetical protein